MKVITIKWKLIQLNEINTIKWKLIQLNES